MADCLRSPCPSSGLNEETSLLEELWSGGQLRAHVEALLRFATDRQAHLRDHMRATGLDPVAALQALIREEHTLDLRREMQDQIAEIEKEMWYRGEEGINDRERIIFNWMQQHASNWRKGRIAEYLFVAEKCAEAVNSILEPTSAERSARGRSAQKIS